MEAVKQNESSDIPQIYWIVRETWLSRRPGVNAQLISALSLLILALGCAFYWNYPGAREWLAATREQVFTHGQYWRLWTTSFAHADLGHLLSNSFMFFILGYLLSGYFGVWVFPVAAFIMGGVTNAFSLATYAPEVRLVGASGIVSWMGGAWLTLYLLLNTKVTLTGRWLRSFGVGLMLFAPAEAFDPKISYRTHMIGFLLGAVWAAWYYRRHRSEFRAAEVREVRVD
jgi:rhomboid protease GluP